MNNIYERSIGLLGEKSFQNIQEKTICILGLGGVGGSALEALFRTGFRNFILIDFDTVSESNLNRQVLYKSEDIGRNKVDLAKGYLLSISKDCKINTINCKAQEYSFNDKIDFVVDAIDDVEGKLYIAKQCFSKKIPFITSLGMANRFDPSKVVVSTLNKTYNDPLAKKLRHEFKESGLSLEKISVVFSSEEPQKFDGKLNSIITVPSSAGLNIAYHIIHIFTEEEKL